MTDLNVSVPILRHTIEILLNELYPDVSALGEGHYSINDILDQLIFELIKEEYKAYADRHTIQHYLDLYDSEHYGTSRKYTRPIQCAQFYRDLDNGSIEEVFGFRLPDLEAQNVTGSNTFIGHQFTEQEFLGIKMQAECKLLNKLYGKQIAPAMCPNKISRPCLIHVTSKRKWIFLLSTTSCGIIVQIMNELLKE